MIILLLMGAGIFAIGLYTLIPVFLFYVGQRRDLYFHPETTWMSLTWWGGAQILAGSGLIAVALRFEGTLMVFLMTTGFIVVWWIISPPLLKRFPPGWIREFEKNRSPLEVDAVRQNGSALLHSYPRIFRQVLHYDWEVWLMTVTHLPPIASLKVYERRAQQAIEHRVFPVAVIAANTIIKHRPDIPLGYELRAQAYFRDHKYQYALDDLTIVLEKQPHHADSYYLRARIYMIMEQPQQAVSDLNRAIELLPEEARFYTLRAAALKVVEEKS